MHYGNRGNEKDGKKNEKPNWEITFFLRDNFYHIYNVEIWDNSKKNFFKELLSLSHMQGKLSSFTFYWIKLIERDLKKKLKKKGSV